MNTFIAINKGHWPKIVFSFLSFLFSKRDLFIAERYIFTKSFNDCYERIFIISRNIINIYIHLLFWNHSKKENILGNNVHKKNENFSQAFINLKPKEWVFYYHIKHCISKNPQILSVVCRKVIYRQNGAISHPWLF